MASRAKNNVYGGYKSNKLKISFTNADMLKNKLTELAVRLKTDQPLIFGVTEVLPKNKDKVFHPEIYNIENYEKVPHPNVEKNFGRGSILYVHKSLQYKQIFLDVNNFDEIILIEIKLDNSDTLLCGLVYRNGGFTDWHELNNTKFYGALNAIAAKKQYSHICLIGDFNYPGINWEDMMNIETNTNQRVENDKFIECIQDCFLFQHVHEPTRQRGGDKPSTLDLILTNEQHMVTDVEIDAPLGASDHSVISFNLICKPADQPPKIKVQYEKGNYNKMRDEFNTTNWEELFAQKLDAESQWECFKNKYAKLEKECVPRKSIFVNGKFSKKFSYPLDEKNLRKIKQKNKHWSRIRKDLASVEEKCQYKKITNQIRRLTRKAKKLYEKNIAQNSKHNAKKFWSYSQQKLKTTSTIPDLLIAPEPDNRDTSEKFTSNDKEKADEFVKYFGSVFTKERNTNNLPFFAKQDFAEELSNLDITQDMLLKKLKSIKINKSPGPDQIHPSVLHEISDAIALPLSIIFRTSLSTQTLPTDWKHARVTAIYKKEKNHCLKIIDL